TGSMLVTTPAVRVVQLVPGQRIDPNDRIGVSTMVRCTVTEGGGSVRDTLVVSDGSGLASCGAWALGTSVGRNTVIVSVSGAQPVAISAFARARPNVLASYDLVSRSGDPDPRFAGEHIVLGADGSMESGTDYNWDAQSAGFPIAPSVWRLSSYS